MACPRTNVYSCVYLCIVWIRRYQKGETFLYFLDLWSRFVELLTQDTQEQNESKKTVVIIRILSLSLIVYLFIPTISFNITSAKGGIFVFLFALAAFGAVFAASYRYKTMWVFMGFSTTLILWVSIFIYWFGWNVGVQHFLIVLLAMGFFVQYNNTRFKILFAIMLCALRLVFYFIFFSKDSVISISARDGSSLQIVNTIITFWCLSVVCYFYGKDSQELEGKLVKYNEELEVMANTDKLTSLFNRRKAIEYIEKCCKKCKDKGFCLCICDIDLFKRVNDTYGHNTGDVVLKEIAKVFKEEMIGKNMAARWGGEEFLLLFPDCNGDAAFVKLCEIRRRIKDIVVKKDDTEIRVTMTFGLAEYDYSGDYEAMLTSADEKLYRGKEDGRDRIVY